MKKIQELFDKVLPYEIIDDNSNLFTARFRVLDKFPVEFRFEAIRDSQFNTWEVSFTAGGSYAVTGTGSQFTVFSTIGAILLQFIRERKPEEFYFYAKEQSRMQLYKVFAGMIKQKANYTFTLKLVGKEMDFTFTRR